MSIKKLLRGSNLSTGDLRAKLAQTLAEEAAEENREFTGIRRKREVKDADSLEKARQELRDEKKAKRIMRRQGRSENIRLEHAKGPRAARKFFFEAGDLVVVRSDSWNHPAKKGEIGIVCDKDDTGANYLNKFEEARWIWVMGPRDLERWDAKTLDWVEDVEAPDNFEEEAELHNESADTEIQEIEDDGSENFEKLEANPIEPLETSPNETIEIAEGNMILWFDEPLTMVCADTATPLGTLSSSESVIVLSVVQTQIHPKYAMYELVCLYGDASVRLCIKTSDNFEVM